MKQSPSVPENPSLPRTIIAAAAVALLATGCTSMEMSGGSSGGGMSGGGMSGGGVSMPGGGSSGGGSSGGSSGGTSGGSSGGMSGGSSGGMSGGSSGGMSGGSSGGMSGGSSGGGTGGINGPMESVEIPGGGGQQGCNDGGITGGGIGGGMGCDEGEAGGVGQFPGGDAERAEQLGKELDESVGDFDEVLMEEQREIETVGRNTEGFDGGSGGGAGSRVSLGEQSAGAMSGGSSGGGGGGGGGGGSAGSSDPLGGMSDAEIAKRTPDDIEVIMDDDIVAKQLREAALAEEDPELRDRLWEEYRKYKGM